MRICLVSLLILAHLGALEVRPAEEAPPPHPLATAGEEMATLVPGSLSSDDARDRAWGAYRAGQLELVDTVPEMRELLATILAGENPRSDVSFPYLVDALIRLGDDGLGEEPMARLLETAPWLGVILAARKPRDHADALLKIVLGMDRGSTWIAAVNLLVEASDQRVLAYLLDGLPVELRVQVVDPDEVEFGGFGGCSMTNRHGDGCILQGQGLPPPVVYSLGAGTLRRGWSLLADGPTPVIYRRREGAGGFGSSARLEKPGRYGLLWAARILRKSIYDLSVDQSVTTIVVLKEEPDLVAAVRQRIDEQRDAYQELLQQLVEHRYLDDELATGIGPTITVKIEDRRGKADPPLPELPEGWTFEGAGNGDL